MLKERKEIRRAIAKVLADGALGTPKVFYHEADLIIDALVEIDGLKMKKEILPG